MKLPLSVRTTLWLLVLLLLLAAWVGMRGLNADSFWLDEIWSIRQAHLASPLDVWNVIAAQDPWQAPGYFMVLNVWGGVSGWSEVAVRALSLFAGLLGIAFTWRLARDLMSPQGALAAAVVLGASAYYLYFFHEARAYTFYVLLTPMMVWAYRRFALSGRWPYALVLGVAIAGALYIHYFAALTAVLLGVAHLSLGLRWLGNSRRWWLLTGVFALCAVLFLPWLGVMLRGISQAETELGVRGANALTSEQMIRGSLFLFSNGSTALMLLALIFAMRRSRRVVLTWAWCLGLGGVLLVINALLGVILEIRYMLALWPVFALLIGLGLERLGQNRLSVFGAFLGIWVAAGLWMSLSPEAAVALRNPHWYLPWREWQITLETRVKAEDAVLVALPDWTWSVYHEDGLAYYLGDLPANTGLVAQPDNVPGGAYAAQVVLDANVRRVWVTFDEGQPTEHLVLLRQALAAEGFTQCAVVPGFDQEGVELFARLSAPAAVPLAGFGDGEPIRAASIMPIPENIPMHEGLTLKWETAEAVDTSTLSAAVHVENSSQHLIAQLDSGLPASSPACVHYDLPTISLDSGSYPLFLTVYEWATGERLPGESADGVLGVDGRVPIGSMAGGN